MHLSANYSELVAAIERVHRMYKEIEAEDAVKENLRFQYQAFLEKEETYFGLQSIPAEDEEKPKRKSNMSKENREKAAERMRAMMARKRAEKEAA